MQIFTNEYAPDYTHIYIYLHIVIQSSRNIILIICLLWGEIGVRLSTCQKRSGESKEGARPHKP